MYTVERSNPVDRQFWWQIDHNAVRPRLPGTITEVEVVQRDLTDDAVQLMGDIGRMGGSGRET